MIQIITKTFSIALIMTLLGTGISRDLRPSDHGLPFQKFPARSPEMVLFFGEQVSPPAPATGSLGSATSDSWLRDKKSDGVRKGLLVATVVCGGTGLALLLAAAVLFVVHFRRQRLRGGQTGQRDSSSGVTPTTSIIRVDDQNK